MKAYEPVHLLAAREAIRFVGTVGDVSTDVSAIWAALVDAFGAREVRLGNDLVEVVKSQSIARQGKPCKPAVARNTLEVASAVRLLVPLVQGSGGTKKFALGDGGRVLRGLMKQPGWSSERLRLVLRRPMFEFHGDYLLQAMIAINAAPADRQRQLALFTDSIRSLAEAKLQELPPSRSGLSWQTYEQELRARQAWITGNRAPQGPSAQPTLEELKRARTARAVAHLRKAKVPATSNGDMESKTFYHHLTRCRAWLDDIRLADRSFGSDQLTTEGEQILSYFRRKSQSGPPLRIPPTAALLKDAFRLEDHAIEAAWGVIVDDAFWEEGLYDVSGLGVYEPHRTEFLEAFEFAFQATRFAQVAEAPLQAMRQVLFYSFLIREKPLRPNQLTDCISEVLRVRADVFSLGHNRQGRPAFVFRKRAA